MNVAMITMLLLSIKAVKEEMLKKTKAVDKSQGPKANITFKDSKRKKFKNKNQAFKPERDNKNPGVTNQKSVAEKTNILKEKIVRDKTKPKLSQDIKQTSQNSKSKDTMNKFKDNKSSKAERKFKKPNPKDVKPKASKTKQIDKLKPNVVQKKHLEKKTKPVKDKTNNVHKSTVLENESLKNQSDKNENFRYSREKTHSDDSQGKNTEEAVKQNILRDTNIRLDETPTNSTEDYQNNDLKDKINTSKSLINMPLADDPQASSSENISRQNNPQGLEVNNRADSFQNLYLKPTDDDYFGVYDFDFNNEGHSFSFNVQADDPTVYFTGCS